MNIYDIQEKAQLIDRVHGLASSHPMQEMVRLLELVINEVRENNDFVEKEDLGWNQGKIAAYQFLKKAIEQGNLEIRKGQ